MVHMDNSSLTETFTRSYFSPQSYQFRHNCLLSTPFLHNVAFLNHLFKLFDLKWHLCELGQRIKQEH